MQNLEFEQSMASDADYCYLKTLKQTDAVSRLHVLAIDSSHTMSCTESSKPDNSKGSFNALSRYVHAASGRWPNIQFMSSDRCGSKLAA